jgi:hypothetical protein
MNRFGPAKVKNLDADRWEYILQDVVLNCLPWELGEPWRRGGHQKNQINLQMKQIHNSTHSYQQIDGTGPNEIGEGEMAGVSTVENHRLHEPIDQHAGMVDKFTVVIKKRIT